MKIVLKLSPPVPQTILMSVFPDPIYYENIIKRRKTKKIKELVKDKEIENLRVDVGV